VAVPTICNQLPTKIKTFETIDTFRKNKKYLFEIAFHHKLLAVPSSNDNFCLSPCMMSQLILFVASELEHLKAIVLQLLYTYAKDYQVAEALCYINKRYNVCLMAIKTEVQFSYAWAVRSMYTRYLLLYLSNHSDILGYFSYILF